MRHLTIGAAIAVAAWAFSAQLASAQTSPNDGGSATASDDVGADGLKHRGDGSIDDDQGDVEHAGRHGGREETADASENHGGHGSDHEHGGGEERADRSGRGSDHERGRDREDISMERESRGQGHGGRDRD